jgi:hypothetical protein
LNPLDLRICKILAAVAGPIPGPYYNPSDVAVLSFHGRFLLPRQAPVVDRAGQRKKWQETPDRKGSRTFTGLRIVRHLSKSVTIAFQRATDDFEADENSHKPTSTPAEARPTIGLPPGFETQELHPVCF